MRWRQVRGAAHVLRLGRAIMAPLRLSLSMGHARSALLGRSVDRRGAPLPWYTYPAIDFLASLDLRGLRVLEYGAGQSTLWWASRGARVTTIEADERWLVHVRSRLASPAEVELIHADARDQPDAAPEGPFDVIVIDGGPRDLLARPALQRLSAQGSIILDNADHTGKAYDGPAILRTLQQAGLLCVPFQGFAPGTQRPHVTAVLFREGSPLLRASPRSIPK